MLYENNNYNVQVFDDHKQLIGTGFYTCQGYGVFNNKTGVVEHSTMLLFDAIHWANFLSTKLDEQLENTQEPMSWPDAMERMAEKE